MVPVHCSIQLLVLAPDGIVMIFGWAFNMNKGTNWTQIDSQHIVIISYRSCGGYWSHHCWERGCATDAVSPVSSKLVLILPTSEGWQAESTHMVLSNGTTGAQTQDRKIFSQSWPRQNLEWLHIQNCSEYISQHMYQFWCFYANFNNWFAMLQY